MRWPCPSPSVGRSGRAAEDATTGNGPIGDIDWTHDWVFLGTGEVQYPAIFRLLAQEHSGDLFLGVCTHTFDASLPVEEQQPPLQGAQAVC